MKSLATLFLLFFSLLTSAQSGNSLELANSGKPKFPIESGKIVYKITGGASGTATLYIDRNGWRQIFIKEITFERFGMSSTERTIEYIDGNTTYKANLDSKKGLIKVDSRWSNLISYNSPTEISGIILEDDGATPNGDTTMLNHELKIWEYSNGSRKNIWEWKGIIFKEDKSLGDLSYIMTAQSFIKNEAISEEVFELPDEIEWKTLK